MKMTVLGHDILIGFNNTFLHYGLKYESFLPIEDTRLHLMDGSILSHSEYSGFVEYVESFKDSNPNFFCTSEEYQECLDNYGVCGKFVYNSEERSVRLPLVIGMTEGSSRENLGNVNPQGLPDHTHYGWASVHDTNSSNSQGYPVGNRHITYRTSDRDGTYYSSLKMESASRNNPIYGRTTKVQQQSVNVLYYIVVRIKE
jgi:hypothetical protein